LGTLVSRDILAKFILQEIDSDRELFCRLLGYLIKHLEDLKAAAMNQEQLGLLAHKAKSGCHAFGALELELALEKIEILSPSKDHEALNKSFKDAVNLMETTLAEIQNVSENIFGKVLKSA
jgi:hypothetical protein